MLLTTPLVVTVGLSLTIPLSLVGQIILQAQYASAPYWVGAAIVFLSFLVVNHESRESGTGIGSGCGSVDVDGEAAPATVLSETGGGNGNEDRGRYSAVLAEDNEMGGVRGE